MFIKNSMKLEKLGVELTMNFFDRQEVCEIIRIMFSQSSGYIQIIKTVAGFFSSGFEQEKLCEEIFSYFILG
jgi:hypothetical protein